MKTQQLLTVLHQAAKLKDTLRHSWTEQNRQESVAEHSWRMAVFAWFLKDDFPEVNIDRVILMCLFHDLGETFTGDIPVFMKSNQDEDTEEALINAWINTLDEPFKSELLDLFLEMEEQKSAEAKLYKAIDKLEVLDQHNLADLSTWIELEYTLNLTHGEKQVAHSARLKELKEAINQETRNKIGQRGK